MMPHKAIHRFAGVAATLLLLSRPASAQAAPPSVAHPPDAASRQLATADVRATIERLFQAIEHRDTAALAVLFAGDSLTIIEGEDINRSWTDYRDNHLVPELEQWRNLVYRPSEIEVHVFGAIAWVLFRYSLKAQLNQHPVDVVGRGTAVLERIGPRWVVRHMHSSGKPR